MIDHSHEGLAPHMSRSGGTLVMGATVGTEKS